jgi:hypothetical protein
MVMVHIYFAVRPEKLWITRSMIRGWITRHELNDHHDPRQWQGEGVVGGAAKATPVGRAAAE